MNTAAMLFSRVALVGLACGSLTLCQPATATQLTREQITAIGYNATVTALTAMVKLERDTFGYADFPIASVRQPVPALPPHLAMDSKASINAIGVMHHDLI